MWETAQKLAPNEIQKQLFPTDVAKPMSIPVPEYRKSGETETAIPEERKPLFRRNGNRNTHAARGRS